MLNFQNKNLVMKDIAALFMCLSCLFLLSSCFGKQEPAPFKHYGGGSGGGSAGIHTVAMGDNLWSISKRYNVDMQDIIIKNRLVAPYKLRIGDRLKMPVQAKYTVKKGDSIYVISRAFGVDMARLARTNNIKKPYIIHEGEVLRIPSGNRSYKNTSKNIKTASVKVSPPKPKKISRKIVDVPPKSSGRFSWPVNGKVISSYGPKKGGLHNDGINIKAARGTPVRSAENGVVAYVGNELEGFGNLVLVRHENRYMSAYAHLDKAIVKKGQRLNKGDVLGKVGSTGGVDTPQLHFEIRKGTKALNPMKYL